MFLAVEARTQQTPFALVEYDRARAAMLADIGDPEKAFLFAEAAVAVGDVRGAIDALERVLTLNPALTNVKFELGLLYLRAGSPELAESYLLDVLADPATPEQIRSGTQALLEDIAAQQARHLFSGSIATALRHDTNANSAPDRLLVGGIPFNLSSGDQSTSDQSAVVALELQHSYDLGGQFGPFIETELTLFSQSYQTVSTSDVFFLSLTSGPRYRLGLDGQHTLRPYVGISTLSLGQTHYGDAVIAGAEYVYVLDDRSSLRAALSSRWQDLEESDVNPTAERFQGRQLRASLGYRRSLTERLVFDGAVLMTDADLDADFESNTTIGLETSLRQSLRNLFDPRLDPGVLSLSAGYAVADYDAANTQINPNLRQNDKRWRIGVSAAMPIDEDIILNAGLTYSRNASNLPNDSYDNLETSIGLRYNFRGRR